MGKLISGILGPIHGKVGTVVGSSINGRYYIKAKPRKRNDQRGDKEQVNQNNFGILHHWLQPLIYVLNVGFKGYAPGRTEFIAAKSYCLKNAFVGEGVNKKLDPSLIQVSYGDLPLPAHCSMELTNGHVLQFAWDTAVPKGEGARNNAYDQAMLLAYDNTTKAQDSKLTGAFRSTGTDTLVLNTGNTYHVFIAFIAHDRSRQSHSVYLGSVTT